MTATEQFLKEKRQYFHQLLLALGEAKYKDVIVNTQFGVDSTKELNADQLDSLIADAKGRLARNKNIAPPQQDLAKDEKQLKTWRNKCLQVLTQRGIMATPKDWSPINNELAKKQYQWILTPDQRAKGFVNHKGLYTFHTVEELKKLFNQLVAIRDNEKEKADKESKLSKLN